MTIVQIYLCGWMLTLCILCVIPMPRQTVVGDAASAVFLLAWPLLWVVSIISALIQMQEK